MFITDKPTKKQDAEIFEAEKFTNIFDSVLFAPQTKTKRS